MQDSKTRIAPEVSEEVLMEIMARLPAKSVMRFKCTSKFLSSLLCSRYFCNRFNMLQSQLQPRLYMSLIDRRYYSRCLLLSSAPSTCPSSSFEFDKDLTIREMGGFFLRGVRGFICFTVFRKAGIYNPSTRQLVILPAIESNLLAVDPVNIFYFICYDPVNDKYKILCTIAVRPAHTQEVRSELWVFVLEAGGSWRRVAKEFHPHFPRPLELTRNGVLYYLAWTGSQTCELVSFDIRSQEFDMMQVPRKAGDVRPRKWVAPIEYDGKVAVFDFTSLKENGTVDLWIVEDWRKKEWSSKTLVLQPSQMHLVTCNRLTPKGSILKDKIILVPLKLTYPFYVLSYDFQNNDLQKVDIKGIPDRWFTKHAASKYLEFDMEFMDPNENIKYLET